MTGKKEIQQAGSNSKIRELRFEKRSKLLQDGNYLGRRKLIRSTGIAELPKNIIFVIEAYLDNCLVGICGLYYRKIILPVLFIAVNEDFRSLGIGKSLLIQLLGATHLPIFAGVQPSNIAAYHLYKALGFKELPFIRIYSSGRIMMHFPKFISPIVEDKKEAKG